jgi:hypothetical protein
MLCRSGPCPRPFDSGLPRSLILKSNCISLRPSAAPSYFSFPRASCPRPCGPPSAYGLAPARLVLAQREVTKRKGPRCSCIACCASAVPCVARKSAAGANSAIHGLEQGRLSLPTCCATRHEPRDSARGKACQLNNIRSATKRGRNEATRLASVAARMADQWGPCQSAGGWRISPKGRAHDARVFFVSTGMCCRKTPQAERGLGGQDARRATGRGGLSLGYFSLATQREVTRAARRAD